MGSVGLHKRDTPTARASETCDNTDYPNNAAPVELFPKTKSPIAFVSYSRDDLEFASRLALDLKQAGAGIWLDKLDIHPGQLWERALEEAVTNCSRIVVILSPASVESENVMAEVAFGLDEKKEIIPVLYRDCKIPFRLRPIQYVDFRKEQDYPCALRVLLQTGGLENATEAITSSMNDVHEGEPHVATILKGAVRRPYPLLMKAGIALAALVAACWFTYSMLSRGGSGARRLRASQGAATQSPASEGTAARGGATQATTPKAEGSDGAAARYPAAIPNFGWAFGLGGVILHTEDGGTIWSAQRSGIPENLVFGTFLTPRIGWVVGADGGVLHTQDGGANWTAQSTTPRRYLASVVFASL